MKPSEYQLDEYKITETVSGDLSWESHFGMGALKEGKCFRKGQILFICPALNKRPGFLKGEFLDHLKTLPVWPKTQSYGVGCPVFHSDTGKRVSWPEMRCWQDEPGHPVSHWKHTGTPVSPASIGIKSPDPMDSDISYSLDHHEIVWMADGRVIWKKCGTHNRITIGHCLIMEGILFMGPGEKQGPGMLKKEFHERLKMLPRWNLTRYYSHDCNLHVCQSVSCRNSKKMYPAMGRHFPSPDPNIRGSRRQYQIPENAADRASPGGRHATYNPMKPVTPFFRFFFQILPSRTLVCFSQWKRFPFREITPDSTGSARPAPMRQGMNARWPSRTAFWHALKIYSLKALDAILSRRNRMR